MAEQKRRRGKNAKIMTPDDPIPHGMEITDTMKKRWTFGNELGSGGCGVVYEGSNNAASSFDFVIKIEHHESGALYTELHAYHAIGKADSINQFVRRKKLDYLGISACYGSGSFDYNDKRYRFLVLQRCGKDLQCVLDENNNTLHPKTVFTIGGIVVNALEYLHSCGYVHQDIKAGNLMLGRTKSTANHVYLLDMGVATRYITKANVHKSSKPNPGRSDNGTLEFLSRDAHNGVFSRRSDLEILGYNMLLWLSGTLPWINDLRNPANLKAQKVRYMNDIPTLMKCLFPSSNYPELEEFLVYVSRLGFEETPRYDWCITMFKRALKSLGFKDDSILILKGSSKTSGKDATASDSQSSQKENNVKKGERKRVNKGASTSSSSTAFASGEVLTPAMLDVLKRQQQKAAEKAAKKTKRKAE